MSSAPAVQTPGRPRKPFLVGWMRKGERGYYYVSPEAAKQVFEARAKRRAS